jgi:hypothetical protein
MRLKPLSQEEWPDEKMLFGVAILASDPSRRQLHAAALYRFGGNLILGDVQSHLTARKAIARPNARWHWIAPDLSEEDQKVLAATADAWLDLNRDKIPYSVAHPGGVVFKNNVWVGNEPGQGMTCATFVMELFDELGIPFIAKETWEPRDGDTDWAESILAVLANQMTKEHVDAQYARIREVVRVRPSDIASAAHLIHQEQEEPLTFTEVAPLALTIESFMLPSFPPVAPEKE